MGLWTLARVGAVVAVLTLAAGCGSGDEAADPSPTYAGPAPAEWLDGSTFTSTEVTGHELVEGTQIELTFEGDRLSASAGCNTQGAPYSLDDGRLAWTEDPASTMMGCDADLMEQDEWLAGLFTAGVDLAGDADGMTLTSGDVTITLTGASAATADLSDLLGTTWTLTTLIDGAGDDGSASSVPTDVRTPTLKVDADGSAALDTGCNRGSLTVEVDGDALSFGPGMLTKMACPGAAGDVEKAMLAVLDGTVDDVRWDGSTLTVMKGEQGLGFDVE